MGVPSEKFERAVIEIENIYEDVLKFYWNDADEKDKIQLFRLINNITNYARSCDDAKNKDSD